MARQWRDAVSIYMSSLVKHEDPTDGSNNNENMIMNEAIGARQDP